MTRLMIRALIAATLLSATAWIGCSASPYLLQRYAVYNFQDEGFLTPGLMQTRGRANVPEDFVGGLSAGRDYCLQLALKEAMRKSLSIFMHTHFDIQSRKVDAAGVSGGFGFDYPLSFTERDYLLAELDFRFLLERGFIALQDTRSAEECTVIFRIKGEDLPAEIKSAKLRFRPEQLEARREEQRKARDARRREAEGARTSTDKSEY